MKYPIGIQTFEDIRERGFVYVDKTALVYKMISDGKIYFLSRPRRFGKSLLMSTLRSYFEGRKDLFEGLAIDCLETEWAKYPVLHFDFNGANFTNKGELEKTLNSQLGKYETIYGVTPIDETFGDRFVKLIEAAYIITGRKCVVLIDEYDKPMLDVLDTEIEDIHRDILKGFYSTFKRADASLRFVLLTGVTKFSQVSIFSGFNQPKDISLHPEYEAICGITEDELFSVFAESIETMAKSMDCTVEDVKIELKRKYDGYHFSKNMTDVYNPFSLLNAFDAKDYGDFWFSSGTPTYLVKLLSHTNENLNDLVGKYYIASEFADYKADTEQPLPMIYQSGYLTIKGYDREDGSYMLDIPNNEVRRGFMAVVSGGYFKMGNGDKVMNTCRQWAADLRRGNVENFINGMTAFLASLPYDSHDSLKDIRLTERHFQYTFYLILRLMGSYSWLFVEKENSYGRSDCIMELRNHVYIFEFKLDGTAEEALQQIEERGYAVPYLDDGRKIVKLGVVFSSETRTISDWKMA
ncbi:MAG: ATP-binding protein [Prevotellaceae bacterium]|nr:ATP-binding protein [Prevotellaceae bacterium]